MSAGRRYRRQIRDAKIEQPAGAVELDAETRRLLAEAMRAHDDPAVSTADYMPIIGALHRRLDQLAEPERLEAAGQILANTLGCNYIGWGKR